MTKVQFCDVNNFKLGMITKPKDTEYSITWNDSYVGHLRYVNVKVPYWEMELDLYGDYSSYLYETDIKQSVLLDNMNNRLKEFEGGLI